MNPLLTIGLLLSSIIILGQNPKTKQTKLLTIKYGGTYLFSKDIKKKPTGLLHVYPETDTTILFYVELNTGEPYYIMSSLYGRMKKANDFEMFNEKFFFRDFGCKWTFLFSKDLIIIETVDDKSGCGFGQDLFPDGKYEKKSNSIPEYFETIGTDWVFFNKTKPEEYYRKLQLK